MKKNSPCGFGSLGRRLCYYKRRSMTTTLKLFVKSSRSLGRSTLLVRYSILQSIKLILITSFGLSIFLFELFEIYQKVENSAYSLQKIGIVYSFQFENAST